MIVAVLCGSRAGSRPQFLDAARHLGARLAEHRIEMLYGGARIGMMGAVADGVLANGGTVHGVIPAALRDFGVEHQGLHSLEVVDGFADQQATMLERADVFIALPGGLGTLYELLMLMTWAQVGLHSKPIVLADVDGYFEALEQTLELAVTSRFISREDLRLIHRCPSVDDAVAALVRCGADGRTTLDISVEANRGRATELAELLATLGVRAAAGSANLDGGP